MVTRTGSLSITHSPIFQWQVQICASLVSFPLLPPMVAYKEICWLWRREWQELFTTSSKHSFPLSFKSSPCWCSPCIPLSEVIFNTLRFCKGRLRAALIIKAFFFSTLFCEMDNYKMDPFFSLAIFWWKYTQLIYISFCDSDWMGKCCSSPSCVCCLTLQAWITQIAAKPLTPKKLRVDFTTSNYN